MTVKRTILISSSFITAMVIIWDYIGNVRLCTWGGVEHYSCLDTVSGIETLFFPIFPIFLLSLFTAWMRDEIFLSWWNFARWVLPIIIVATIFVNMMPKDGGFFNMDALVYLIVVAPLYAILILVSLWKIVRTYLKLKKT